MEIKGYQKPVQDKKKKVMISFQTGRENGGPHISHTRIMNSGLKDIYEYIPYTIPNGRIGFFNIKLIRHLMKQIKDANPDLVHIHGLQLAGFHYAMAAHLCKKPIVLAVRGSSGEAREFAKWKKALVHILEKKTIKMSDIVYGVSDYVCNWDIVKKYAKGKLYGTVYNLMQLDNSVNSNSRQMMREKLGLASEDIVVVSTGRITEEKGFKILCETVCKLKNEKHIKFLIVGDGSYLNEFKEKIKAENLEEKVIFTGYQKDVNLYLECADIFAICSLHETLCNSLIEAGAKGLPLVAPKIGGMPEIVKHSENGILLERNDADCVAETISMLSKDDNIRRRYGQNARKYIEDTFGQEVIISKIQEMYEICFIKNIK